ncbi:nuclear transport factor 2 family protein [Streptomyces sp. ISL-87]|nr:nuclear transport factor 2 family protein [Streptomyces sp. ISL-21]MBT2609299.1 nuclear transport factor 2 family protein [Streptomyces sp. ISL-87]
MPLSAIHGDTILQRCQCAGPPVWSPAPILLWLCQAEALRFDDVRNTDLLIDVDGDGEGDGDGSSATASWNSLMTHVHHEAALKALGEDLDPLFTVGGVWEADLRRTSAGWRISRTSVRPLWMSGTAPQPAANA